MRSTTVALLKLATESRLAFDAWLANKQLAVDFSSTGKLVLFSSRQCFAGAQKQLLLQHELGSVPTAIGPAQCTEIEPALASCQQCITGATYTPGESAADCQNTCDGLLASLRLRGVLFLLNTLIEKVRIQAGAAVAVKTPRGAMEADHYVMALGPASAPLARQLGVYLQIYLLKGYSITVDVDDVPHAARLVSVTDSAGKLVFARFGSRLRVAGTAELAGCHTGLAPAQIDSLKMSAQALFPHCSQFAELNPWAGLRPATPTGLPLISYHPSGPGNLLLNVGHGALKLTLAFGSAARVAARLEITSSRRKSLEVA